MDVIVYGGAFDPPHLDHQYILETIAKLPCKKILIIPSGPRYDKKGYHISTPNRKKLVEILIADLQNPNFEGNYDWMNKETSTFEIHNWVEANIGKATHVFGTDTAEHMHLWKNPENILKRIPKIFLKRNGKSVQNKEIENYTEISINTGNLSSTQIRKNIKEKNDYTGLPPKIKEIIQERGLYKK
jgi:nicotinate (nicotinamide) nucleotide adenylyltransferase